MESKKIKLTHVNSIFTFLGSNGISYKVKVTGTHYNLKFQLYINESYIGTYSGGGGHANKTQALNVIKSYLSKN